MRKIIELLDNPAKYTQVNNTQYDKEYAFTVDSKIYKTILKITNSAMTVALLLRDNLNIELPVLENYIDELQNGWEIHFQIYNKETDEFESELSGTGNQFTVFATLLEILKDLINIEHPNYIVIISSTNEPSRVKLYEFFAQKIGKYINYTYIGKNKMKAFGMNKAMDSFFVMEKNLFENIGGK